MTTTVNEVLTSAVSLAERVGLATGNFYQPTNKAMCIDGILLAVLDPTKLEKADELSNSDWWHARTDAFREPNSLYNQARDRIALVTGETFSREDALAAWNNVRSHETVISALRQAAEYQPEVAA